MPIAWARAPTGRWIGHTQFLYDSLISGSGTVLGLTYTSLNGGHAVSLGGFDWTDLNGNGRIDLEAEIGAVWSHLSVAGFLNGTFTGLDAGGAALTVATYPNAVASGGVPPNAFQGPIMLAHSEDYIEGNARGTVVRLAYSFGGNIPVPLLRDLDQKLDNGIAGSGVLRSAAESTQANPGTFNTVTDYTAGGDDCLNADNPQTWNVDSSNQTCNAMFLF